MGVVTSRREFVKAAAGVALAGATAARSRTTAPVRQKHKPNLLFLWTDEQRADTMAAYGNQRIHTPRLNRLAQQSVVFRNAYVTQPVCTPNRSAVMTGLWPHTTGCIKNNVPLPSDVPCLPELLADPDYRTAYMGKWHLGDEIFAQHGFQRWVSIEDGYSRYYSEGRSRKARSDYHHFLIDRGYEPDDDGRFSRSFAARRSLEQCKPAFLEGEACDFLRRHRREPFVLYVNFLEPHMPFFGPLDREHHPREVELPENFRDLLEDNEPLRYRIIRECCRARYGSAERDIRDLIARYWGLVTQVDRSVGAILATLEDLGLADETIVVYTSDHGDMMGSHHMVEKSVMYEEAVRIPWLMRVPQVAGRRVGEPVSQIDMVPTLLDLMGRTPDARLPGRSLAPLMKGRDVAPEHVLIQWNPDSGAMKVKPGGTSLASKQQQEHLKQERSRAVVTPDGWKRCLSDRDKSQLFNLRDDPGETTNLFDSDRHRDIVGRLTGQIHQWQESVADGAEV